MLFRSFETVQLTLKKGGTGMGIVRSETNEEVVLALPGGATPKTLREAVVEPFLEFFKRDGAIATLKIFDIVLAMTGGAFKTSVLGYQFYQEYFLNSNVGAASAICVSRRSRSTKAAGADR